MRPRVPFSACLEGWAADTIVDDYHSAAAGKKVAVSCGKHGTLACWMRGMWRVARA